MMVTRKGLLQYADDLADEIEMLRIEGAPEDMPIDALLRGRLETLHAATGYHAPPGRELGTAYDWLMEMESDCLVLAPAEEVA